MLRDFEAQVDLDADILRLPSGLTCKFSLGYCFDAEDGDIVWDVHDFTDCVRDPYDLLYYGMANITALTDNATYLTVANKFHLTALRLQDPTEVCNGHRAFLTDHPRVLVLLRVVR